MKRLRFLLLLYGLLSLVRHSSAQIMPQDNWKWDGKSILGNFRCLELAPNNLLYTSLGTEIKIFNKNLNLVGSFPSPATTIYGIASDSQTNVYVLSATNITVYDQNGNFLRKWGGSGNGDGQFSLLQTNTLINAIAIDKNDRVYLADGGNSRVQVFDKTGNLLSKWGVGIPAGLDGSFVGVQNIATTETGKVATYSESPNSFQLHDFQGNFILRVPDLILKNLDTTPEGIFVGFIGDMRIASPNMQAVTYYGYPGLFGNGLNGEGVSGSTFDKNGDMWIIPNPYNSTQKGIYSLKRTYQPDLALNPTFIPIPTITRIAQRPGLSIVDIDYKVTDNDSPQTDVAILAFQKNSGMTYSNSVNSLASLVKMNTFIEGTHTNLGLHVPSNTDRRVSWDLSGDTTNGIIHVEIEVLAKDDRELLPFHLITIPEGAGLGPIKVSSKPLSDADFLNIWFWLVATNNTSITFTNGAVYGLTGEYTNIKLAQGVQTTVSGRKFILDMIGARSLTVGESAVINQGRYGFPQMTTTNNAVK